MNKPSKKVWKILHQGRISKNDRSILTRSPFIIQLFKIQWSREKLPINREVDEPDFEGVWKRIDSSIVEKSKPGSFPLHSNFFRYAAVFLIALLSFFAGGQLEWKNPAKVSETLEHISPKGARSVYRLPDNSVLWLNAGSRIIYDENFGITNREIFLEGEAIFEVSENEELPFIVQLEGHSVTALGTEFYLSGYSFFPEIHAGLLKGSIEVIFNGQKIRMNESGTLGYSKENKKLLPTTNLNPSHYEWKNGQLIFSNASLGEISHRLSNWFNAEIKAEESVKNQKFTMSIEEESLEEVLELIKLASQLDVKQQNQEYIIYSP